MVNLWRIRFDRGDLTVGVMRKIKKFSYFYTIPDGEKYDAVNRILWHQYSHNYYLSFTDYFFNDDTKAIDRHLWFAIKDPLDEETQMLLKLI
jgi:hypothetical protein